MNLPDLDKPTDTKAIPSLSAEQRRLIRDAVDAGIERYIKDRKAKVPAFVAEHFLFRGTLRLHRKALGKDLYKAPLNVIWLLPLAATRAGAFLLDKMGAVNIARRLKRLPSGFQTDVQKEVVWLIYTELLELPFRQEAKTSTKDALLEAILQDAKLATLIDGYLNEILRNAARPDFRRKLELNLQTYAGSRAAASEIAGNIITLCSSYAALQQTMPGALSAGAAAATAIAQKIAIAQFWLGPALGAWYYGLFPVTASAGLVVAVTGAVMAALGVISAFTGIIADPLQTKLGLHQKRLYRFIDVLAAELKGEPEAKYGIDEIYLGRIFDILDLLRLATRS
ncbi:DUF6635 family protein [Methylomonas sp. MgM2]